MNKKHTVTSKLEIRETTSGVVAQVLALYPQAFPDEELRPVVSALLDREAGILSLAAFDDDALVAHILFTLCGVEQKDQTAALLAPLGVLPSYQGQGLGSALVRAGLEELERRGLRQVFVLGDPAYYHRFGFKTERRILPPYTIPEQWADAWQSMTLAARTPLDTGQLLLPAPWMDPALWAA